MLAHIPTTDVAAVVDLAADCHATRSIGVVCGPNGTGKTDSLKALQRRWGKDLPGKAFYLRCTQFRGVTSGLKDLLEAMGRRQAGANASGSLNYTLKIARTELQRQDIRAVLLDEADLWGLDGLSAAVALYDSCLDVGQPVTLIMASAAVPETWMHVLQSGRSRSLRTFEFRAMSAETMVAVLRAWGMPNLADGIAAGEAAAVKVANRLHSHTGGLFRRLGFFVSLHALHCPGQPITATTLEKILPRIAGA